MIVCADDFGISQSVSDGIIELLSMERLTAVSCMLNYDKNIDNQMVKLINYKSNCDIGLHLNLTSGRPLTNGLDSSSGLVDQRGSFLSFNKLLKNVLTNRVNTSILFNEIEKQLNFFALLTNFLPNFIDGHQHVQQLPIIRDVLLELCAKIYKNNKFYLRVGTFPLRQAIVNNLSLRMIIGSVSIDLFAKRYNQMIKSRKILCNNNLLGYHNYNSEERFEDVFSKYLTLVSSNNDIFFMHPGYIDDDLISRDSLVNGRLTNLEFMKSDCFHDLLKKNNLTLTTYDYA